jgi:uncharacterized protein YeaO (DUF488 family)
LPIKLKRAYEPASSDDGERILVERLWPRGVTKKDLALTGWLRDIAPSTELRKWYGHIDERWPEFVKRYRSELRASDKRRFILELVGKGLSGDVTLVFATHDPERSGAQVLKDVIEKAGIQSARVSSDRRAASASRRHTRSPNKRVEEMVARGKRRPA